MTGRKIFTDLRAKKQKDEFTNNLLQASLADAWAILLEQYQLHPDILGVIAKHYESYDSRQKRMENFKRNRELILCIQKTPEILLHGYRTLTNPRHRQQFILGLLMADYPRRQKILSTQEKDKRNIESLATDLERNEAFMLTLFQGFPTFATLKTTVATILKEYQVAETPSQTAEAAQLSKALKEEADADEWFIDKIEFEQIKAAVITPMGKSYDRTQIQAWIQTKFNEQQNIPLNKRRAPDPVDKSPLIFTVLLPNFLLDILCKQFKEPEINLQCFYDWLRCPLSDEIFVDPVVAQNGRTYSRQWLEAYLAEHNDILPGDNNVKQTSTLYPNEFIQHILKAKVTQDVIAFCETENDARLSPEIKKTVTDIRSYTSTRLNEPVFARFKFIPEFIRSALEWKRWSKLENAVHLKKLAQGREDLATFKIRNNPNALFQGRLNKMADETMREYNKQIGLKK